MAADELRVIRLRDENPLAWALMPEALSRVRTFCRKYDSDADADLLCAHIKRNFDSTSMPEPNLLLLVGVQGGRMVGHLLASLDEWCGSRHLSILQYEADQGVAPPVGLMRAVLDQLGEWARQRGATAIQLLARNPALVRAFQRHYGFRVEKTLMRRSL